MRILGSIILIGLGLPVFPASGQAFNLDFGGTDATRPSSGYGAGSGQSGFWETAYSGNIRDTSGNLTAVVLGSAATSGSGTIPGAAGDDKAMMESVWALPSFAPSFSLQHVAAGVYDCYIYSWAPRASGTHTVNFAVSNGAVDTFGSVTYGPGWPGGQVQGVTFARVPITVLPQFQVVGIQLSFFGDSDIVNGFQLVPVPAPGSALALLALPLAIARRRR